MAGDLQGTGSICFSAGTPGHTWISDWLDAKAANLDRGWNFAWDGQAGLGHPPWGGGCQQKGGSARRSRAASANTLGKNLCYSKLPAESVRCLWRSLWGKRVCL